MKFSEYIRKALSEATGSPSASRLTMALLSLVSSAAILMLVIGVLKSDVAKAALILTSLPLIIGALAAWMVSPYGVNKFGKNPPDETPKPPAN